ncbi:FKBP-type peptidyl-prolyl cis-trans isomerase [Vreelandella subglaciescola]|jgi:FKBP-type peptidyl-prolyl cis-trans isomerase SlyD|uniref:Peptidyl-prolyl cis-trans isomerase n=1 Tax=Vreelandella subglaciescola TaxID=29571 RepID=A0A1M7IE45_9GAMM|nr:peptidylprolyl isomerase [Halomonas subglaciescola]SHM38960.1 FKBP-type peptidyl prolyl cis-trans isomerase /Apo-metallochaperone SlyD [Halomonas subglaciescola]
MQIAQNSVVAFHYTLTNDAGEVLDSSEGREPLTYLHGGGNIIPGLEKELEGRTAGEKLNVNVSPEEGYGEVQEQLMQEVPRESFQGVESVEPGMQFQAQTEGGPLMVTVKKVEADTVVVDGNHPLAGQQLAFDVEIATVREASEDEIEHGHVHGEGGVEHEDGVEH